VKIMPYPNEHSCRLEDPDKYESFKRKNCEEKHEGKCIDVIYGVKDGESEIQALRYKTDIWDEDDAREHCEERGGKFEPAGDEEDDRGMVGERELRMFDLDNLELRVGAENEAERWLTGHGAVYDVWSVDLGGFTELFEQGAFTDSIKRDDIRSLRDHTDTFILGRNKAGTLLLEEDKRGVRFEVLVPDTSYGHDLVVSVERGDVTGCSIIFSVDKKGERWFVDGEEVDFLDALMSMWDEKKHKVQRRVSKSRLYDIGPVTFPAYPQTDIKARSLAVATGIDYRALGIALGKTQRGMTLDEKESKLLARAGDMIRRNVPAGPVPEPDGAGASDGVAARLKKVREILRFGTPKVKTKNNNEVKT